MYSVYFLKHFFFFFCISAGGRDEAGIGEGCLRLMPLCSCVAPCRTRCFTPRKLPSTPNGSTQVLIVGGLPGHFRLGCENLEEWVGSGEAGGAGRPRSGFRRLRAECRAPLRGLPCVWARVSAGGV